jgi:CheY-like chemotaxis protein
MTKLFGLLVLIGWAGVALGTDSELGHPLFRTFDADDYGEVGLIYAITEDPQGRMLFGAPNVNRAILTELLSTVGFDTIEADSPEEALRLLKDHFDAIVSDIRMPGWDGHKFCRHLRSSPTTANLIIIASSASVFADDQRLALDSGARMVNTKPNACRNSLGRRLQGGCTW